MNYTDEELVKSLRNCVGNEACINCALLKEKECRGKLNTLAADRIEELQKMLEDGRELVDFVTAERDNEFDLRHRNCERLEAKIDELKREPGWISVKNKLPEESGHYWVNLHQSTDDDETDFVIDAWYTPNSLFYTKIYVGWEFLNEWYDLTNDLRQDITHWKPYIVPEPPKEEE